VGDLLCNVIALIVIPFGGNCEVNRFPAVLVTDW
jgi:hypothetical protein